MNLILSNFISEKKVKKTTLAYSIDKVYYFSFKFKNNDINKEKEERLFHVLDNRSVNRKM